MHVARIARLTVIACLGVLGATAQAGAADYAFTPAAGSPFETNSDPFDVVVADIDEDGFRDAVLGDYFGGTISVFWGTAGGTFDTPPLELSGSADQIVVVDLNGDGHLDIGGAAYVFTPHFRKVASPREFTTGPDTDLDDGDGFVPAVGMVAANFDAGTGDTDNDLAITTQAISSGGPSGAALRILKNDPTGTFTLDHTEFSRPNDYAGDLVVGRFNADADPDLAYVWGEDSLSSQDRLGRYFGAAGVDFAPQPDTVLDDYFDDLASADLDADGHPDLVMDGSVDVRWGNADGTFSAPQEIAADEAADYFFGDFNDDGKLDIGAAGAPTRFFTNQGGRTFALGAQLSEDDYFPAGAAGDLDGDPRDDVVLGDFFSMTVLRTGDPVTDPPPDGGGGGTTPPPPGDSPPPSAPPPSPPPSPPLTQPVVPVRANQIALLPSARKRPCGSRRNFRIRLRRPPAGVTVLEARVLVNGKRVKVVRGARLTAPVDLRGFPRGRAVVTIRITLADGRVLRGRRVYHPCATKKRKGKFGRRRRG